jgi:hypothetical protein
MSEEVKIARLWEAENLIGVAGNALGRVKVMNLEADERRDMQTAAGLLEGVQARIKLRTDEHRSSST